MNIVVYLFILFKSIFFSDPESFQIVCLSVLLNLQDEGYSRTCFTHYSRYLLQYSSINGRFWVQTTELRRVHMYSSLLVVTSNYNASNKTKSVEYISYAGMSHYIPCLIAEKQIYYGFSHCFFFKYRLQPYWIYLCLLFSFFRISRCPFPYL